MKFCSQCAHPVVLGVPPDDHLPRHICQQCGTIHYDNPKIVVCTIPVWQRDGETRVLLCKRAIEPRYGYWTLPGGFMENKETTAQAALRETAEEAGARIELQGLHSLINLPAAHQVHLFYRASMLDLELSPGAETIEGRLFSRHEIPWSQLAFSTVKYALELFFEDAAKIARGESQDGNYGFYAVDVLHSRYPS